MTPLDKPGVLAAAAYIENKAAEFAQENAYTEPDTGARHRSRRVQQSIWRGALF